MDIWSLFDLLAPPCLVCGLNAGRGPPLCPGCRQDIPAIPAPCPTCALPLPDPGAAACPACRRGPPLTGIAVAATAYGFPIDSLVQQLKFGGRQPVARVLGDLLADTVRDRYRELTLPSALVPVPLHPARQRQRGFNQAERIAAAAGTTLGIPVLRDAVQRLRATPAQSGLDLRQRRRNLRNAFRVTGELPAHVAIVDDVVTTGSTLLALGRTLHDAGVTRIDAWAVARTL